MEFVNSLAKSKEKYAPATVVASKEENSIVVGFSGQEYILKVSESRVNRIRKINDAGSTAAQIRPVYQGIKVQMPVPESVDIEVAHYEGVKRISFEIVDLVHVKVVKTVTVAPALLAVQEAWGGSFDNGEDDGEDDEYEYEDEYEDDED